jgi:hypothetical protein
LYVHVIWISTKPYITHMEGINAYVNKYAYKYTYIFICDSLIILKFGALPYTAVPSWGCLGWHNRIQQYYCMVTLA